MSEKDLESYLRNNNLSEEQVDMIKKTQKALQRLRSLGISGEGYTLTEPYTKGTGVPSAARRKALKSRSRSSFGRF